MTRIDGLGVTGGQIPPSGVRPQQTQAFALPTERADAGNPPLDFAELESQARVVRGAIIQQETAQESLAERASEIYPWPLRVFTHAANLETATARQSGQSDLAPSASGPTLPRLDVMA